MVGIQFSANGTSGWNWILDTANWSFLMLLLCLKTKQKLNFLLSEKSISFSILAQFKTGGFPEQKQFGIV